jgi:hypothetical protein
MLHAEEKMQSLLTEELAEQRRRELLRQAEHERLVSSARSAWRSWPDGTESRRSRRRWRVVVGLALVRVGARLGGAALADSMVVVPGRGARPAMLAVVWRGNDDGPPRRAGTGQSSGRPPVLSRW